MNELRILSTTPGPDRCQIPVGNLSEGSDLRSKWLHVSFEGERGLQRQSSSRCLSVCLCGACQVGFCLTHKCSCLHEYSKMWVAVVGVQWMLLSVVWNMLCGISTRKGIVWQLNY